MDPSSRSLSQFTGAGYVVGRPRVIQALWQLVSGTVVTRWWCPARVRVAILRAFGADIGAGVLIRHRVRVHWPWKLVVGSNSWIGEGAWVLNLEPVVIGHDACISQEVLLCTGSHLRESPTFDFDNGPIKIGDGAWVCARAVILRGVQIGSGAVIGANCVVSRDVPAGSVNRSPTAAGR